MFVAMFRNPKTYCIWGILISNSFIFITVGIFGITIFKDCDEDNGCETTIPLLIDEQHLNYNLELVPISRGRINSICVILI